ncbi:MAG: membrane dipeptidase [Bacteroidales bacterium]|nr:membrane dipeptidase [Bacteroidales bacterium]
MEDISKLPKIFDQLTIRGYSEDQIEKIAGGNFIRAFNDVISCALRQ